MTLSDIIRVKLFGRRRANEYTMKDVILAKMFGGGGGDTKKPTELLFTLTSDLTISLNITQSSPNAVTVDWGDGSEKETNDATLARFSHTYAAAGDYTVKVACAEGETWSPGTSMYGLTGSSQVNKTKLIRAVLGEGTIALIKNAFARETKLQSIVIPDSVTEIGATAISYCSSLTDIYLGDGVKSTSGNPFQSTAIKNIYLKSWDALLSFPRPQAVVGELLGSSPILKDIYVGNVLQSHLIIPLSISEIYPRRLAKLGSVKTVEINSPYLYGTAFQYSTGIEKVWIRETVETMVAAGATAGPFANCDPSMVLYCEVDEKPEGWGQYWNYVASGKACQVIWGQKTSPF